MTDKELDKMYTGAPLLGAPAHEVVCSLITEIRALRSEREEARKLFADLSTAAKCMDRYRCATTDRMSKGCMPEQNYHDLECCMAVDLNQDRAKRIDDAIDDWAKNWAPMCAEALVSLANSMEIIIDSELSKQCRLNGICSEREARLMARVSEMEKENAELLEGIEGTRSMTFEQYQAERAVITAVKEFVHIPYGKTGIQTELALYETAKTLEKFEKS